MERTGMPDDNAANDRAGDDVTGDDRQGVDGRSQKHAETDDLTSDEVDQPAVDAADGDVDMPDPLLAVLESPADGRHRLPYLLGLLDGEDPRERLAAATAVCLVVESHPELLAYAVGRLVDRLDEDAPVEVAHALDYLAARHPRAVDEAVADLPDAAERRARRRMYRTGGGFARNEYLAPTQGDRPIGRTRVAGSGASDDPRRTYTTGDEDDRPDWQDEDDADDEAGDGDEADDGEDGDADHEAEEPPGEADVVGQDDPGRGVTSGTLQLVSRRLSAVIERSRFDDLTVLTERRRGRHGDVYRTAGTLDGDAYAVALTVYRLPETGREAFARGLGAALSDWNDVDDHESVRSVYDWGLRPRPWAALDYANLTLADRDDDPPDPLWTAIQVADALAHAHQHGVVHGAVDPGTVAYRDDAVTESERQPPLLSNVALAAATDTARPGRGVDPRYAAPEHYDDRFGRVDHATDVYGLGVIIYRLCTGDHPYSGDPETVRDGVLADDAPQPTAVDPDLPAALDQVVGKATATRKLKRYETVNTLGQELRAIRDGT